MDALKGKIPNKWLLVGVLAGMWCRGKDFLPAAVVMLILTFFLFRLGMMGAGDGKLMAVIAGYLGMDAGIEAIFTGMVIGALWSLCRLWHGHSLKIRLINLAVYFLQIFQTGKIVKYNQTPEKRQTYTIPLAVCMAGGTYLYLIVSGAAALWSGWLVFR